MIYAVKNIKASRVNLVMNDYAAGLPSPLSFLGLAAAIAPALGVDRWSIGVLPVLHQVSVSDGRTKPEMDVNGQRFSAKEMVEDMTGFVDLSLLFDIPVGMSSEIGADVIREALVGKRIAGGIIVPSSKEDKSEDVVCLPTDGAGFLMVSRGYVFSRPRHEENHIIATNKVSDFSKITDLLYPAKRTEKSGWLVPAAVGHRLLENPSTAPKRSGVRDASVPHVFTEPVLGIAELISSRNPELLRFEEKQFLDLFWRWDATGEWVVGHPSYNPDRKAA